VRSKRHEVRAETPLPQRCRVRENDEGASLSGPGRRGRVHTRTVKHPHRPRPERKYDIANARAPRLERATIAVAELSLDSNQALQDAAPSRRERRYDLALLFVRLRAPAERRGENGRSSKETASLLLHRMMRVGDRLCDCAPDTVAPVALASRRDSPGHGFTEL